MAKKFGAGIVVDPSERNHANIAPVRSAVQDVDPDGVDVAFFEKRLMGGICYTMEDFTEVIRALEVFQLRR
jgi:hypothetical protein